jgi:hypothetical protein
LNYRGTGLWRAGSVLLSAYLLFQAFPAARGDATYKTMNDMIVEADVIAVVRIERVDDVNIKKSQWTYSKRAVTSPLQVVKGTLPQSFSILGGENFRCAQCKFEPGKALVFLDRDGDAYVGNNWQFSIRPIRDTRLEWFKDENSLVMEPKPAKIVIAKVKSKVRQDADLEKLPQCMETLRKAKFLSDGVRGEGVSVTTEYTAYKEALALKGVEPEALELMLKRATPAGKIYTALLMAKHYPTFGKEVLESIKSDNRKITCRTGCEVLDFTVGQAATELLTKKKFLGFAI